jgi:hypothetical protein
MPKISHITSVSGGSSAYFAVVISPNTEIHMIVIGVFASQALSLTLGR